MSYLMQITLERMSHSQRSSQELNSRGPGGTAANHDDALQHSRSLPAGTTGLLSAGQYRGRWTGGLVLDPSLPLKHRPGSPQRSDIITPMDYYGSGSGGDAAWGDSHLFDATSSSSSSIGITAALPARSLSGHRSCSQSLLHRAIMASSRASSLIVSSSKDAAPGSGNDTASIIVGDAEPDDASFRIAKLSLEGADKRGDRGGGSSGGGSSAGQRDMMTRRSLQLLMGQELDSFAEDSSEASVPPPSPGGALMRVPQLQRPPQPAAAAASSAGRDLLGQQQPPQPQQEDLLFSIMGRHGGRSGGDTPPPACCWHEVVCKMIRNPIDGRCVNSEEEALCLVGSHHSGWQFSSPHFTEH